MPNHAAAALLAAGLLAPAAAVASADPVHPTSGLHGEFIVVDQRAKDGGTPDDPVEDPSSITFGETVTWYDGRSCMPWSAEATAGEPAVTSDPLLSDLWVPPVGEIGMFEDHRRGQTVEIVCDGETFGELVIVDDRVLYVEEANGYVILERPLEAEAARELQWSLNRAGHDAGPEDGAVGPQTRAAVADYAVRRGAEPADRVGVVTENILEGVGFTATD